LAAHTEDEGFHEIQLNGKQLVFFFMAATVVLVVVFLCGVLVGRGVRTERAGASSEVAGVIPSMEPAPAPPAPAPSAESDPRRAAAPSPTPDELTYDKRLSNPEPASETLKPSTKNEKTPSAGLVEKSAGSARAPEPLTEKKPVTSVAAAPASGTLPPPAPAVPPKTPAPAPVPAASAPKSVGAFVVQVAASKLRSEADAIAKRLASKGYDAYVMDSAPGTRQVYRVRVGRFGSRREAQTMATKLQKEEQFKPWVTR